jgi:hypothetical protein
MGLILTTSSPCNGIERGQERFHSQDGRTYTSSLECLDKLQLWGLPNLLSKAIPVTGGGSIYVRETPRLAYFLGSRFRDGGEVVGLTLRPHFTPPLQLELLVLISVTDCQPQGHSAAGKSR